MTKHPEIYACLYAREFPAQALLRLRPELRNKPCVVMEGEPPLQQVCSLTRKARSLGMARGMTQVEVDTFSGVTMLAALAKEEAAAKAILLECAGCFSPRVEDCSPDCNQDRSFLCAHRYCRNAEVIRSAGDAGAKSAHARQRAGNHGLHRREQ